jgi:hypothetical protein
VSGETLWTRPTAAQLAGKLAPVLEADQAGGTVETGGLDSKAAIERIYERHCPEKLGNVDKLLRQYEGREEELLQKVATKYQEAEDEMLEIEREKAQMKAEAEADERKAKLDGKRKAEKALREAEEAARTKIAESEAMMAQAAAKKRKEEEEEEERVAEVARRRIRERHEARRKEVRETEANQIQEAKAEVEAMKAEEEKLLARKTQQAAAQVAQLQILQSQVAARRENQGQPAAEATTGVEEVAPIVAKMSSPPVRRNKNMLFRVKSGQAQQTTSRSDPPPPPGMNHGMNHGMQAPRVIKKESGLSAIPTGRCEWQTCTGWVVRGEKFCKAHMKSDKEFKRSSIVDAIEIEKLEIKAMAGEVMSTEVVARQRSSIRRSSLQLASMADEETLAAKSSSVANPKQEAGTGARSQPDGMAAASSRAVMLDRLKRVADIFKTVDGLPADGAKVARLREALEVMAAAEASVVEELAVLVPAAKKSFKVVASYDWGGGGGKADT